MRVWHRSIRAIALALAIALHLAVAVGLLGRFSPRKLDEVPVTLDLVMAPPPTPDVTPTEPPLTAQTPDPTPQPDAPAADNSAPTAEPVPPDAQPPVPAAPQPVPALPKEVPTVLPPPTPFRRSSRPAEPPRPHAPASAPARVAPVPHDEASASPTPAPVQQPVQPPPAPSSDPAWSSALSGWLQGHRTYPEAARRRGEQGQVGVRFTVLHDGQVQDVKVTRPSGYDALDEAAQTMLQSAHVPPFPASMTQASMTVTVTIRFTLEK